MGQLERRRFLLAAGVLLAAPEFVVAQARSVRIGYLAPRQRSVFLPAILNRLGELGFVQGKNLVVEYRSADGVMERYPGLARELIRAKCDLLIDVGSGQGARALLEAKAPVPVVIVAVNYDPVKAGLVSSLRYPGGNVTGMVIHNPPVEAKRLEILREILPNAKRFLALVDPFNKESFEAVRSAAERLRLEIVVETFATPPYDIESAFARGRAAGVEGVIVIDSPTFFDHRRRIGESVMKHGLPSIVNLHYFDQSAFLVSYGINFATVALRVGDIAASLLKGAKASEIPVEQPLQFELAVNMKTAKALGILIPPSIMARAVRVIE